MNGCFRAGKWESGGSRRGKIGHMRMKSRAWLLLAVMAAAPVSAAPSSCALAEEATDGLDSWPKVYHAYQQFPECDDGGVAEGYADKIEQLLADHWSDLDVLMKLVKSDPNFEAFVFRHLGEITTLPNAQAITRHGVVVAFVVSTAEYDKIIKPKNKLSEFFSMFFADSERIK